MLLATFVSGSVDLSYALSGQSLVLPASVRGGKVNEQEC